MARLMSFVGRTLFAFLFLTSGLQKIQHFDIVSVSLVPRVELKCELKYVLCDSMGRWRQMAVQPGISLAGRPGHGARRAPSGREHPAARGVGRQQIADQQGE